MYSVIGQIVAFHSKRKLRALKKKHASVFFDVFVIRMKLLNQLKSYQNDSMLCLNLYRD